MGLPGMPQHLAHPGRATFPGKGEHKQTGPAGAELGAASEAGATGIPQGFLSFHRPKNATLERYASESPKTLH